MRWFWLFVAYSFLGFLLETGFTALRTGRLANRKTMLLLPLCPVYGLGGATLVWINESLFIPPVAFAVLGGLVCTAIEYVYSLACELLFRVRLWDYGQGRGSVNGRVHLLFCIYWIALILPVIVWIQPMVQSVISSLPNVLFPWAAALVLADAIATATLLYRFGRKGGRMPGCPVAKKFKISYTPIPPQYSPPATPRSPPGWRGVNAGRPLRPGRAQRCKRWFRCCPSALRPRDRRNCPAPPK